MRVECKFKKRYNKLTDAYKVSNQVVCESKWEKSLIFFGENIEDSFHEQIREIYFKNCVMKRLPGSLSKILPNLEILSVVGCGLEEISREDLSGFKSLKALIVKNNELTFLPENLFDLNREIEEISFKGNMLIHVGRDILKPLTNLKLADFRGNLRINYRFKTPPYESVLANSKLSWLNCCLKKLEKKISQTEEMSFAHRNGCKQDIDEFLSNDEFKDFKIVINETEFKVHKFLFAARSPVLRKMMTQNSTADSIELENIKIEIFQIILDFVYDEKLPNAADIIEIYAAAAQLQIRDLEEFAASKIISSISSEDSLQVLFMANQFNNQELKMKAFDCIKSFFPDKKLRLELADNPEAVRKLISAKLEIEKICDSQ